ncbi:MAG: lasso peptide biosynthesis B2 protein [Anaerolineales bacterium]|nr:lasso peptide biosynthesis B2 protein [Anaerolineales bacterium]
MGRWRHITLALRLAPGLLRDARRRARLAEMRAFCRALPAALNGPWAEALPRLEPGQPVGELDESTVRDLADLAALLERRSPLGLCLRRSLTRYHFLRRAGVPVVVRFGARLAGPPAERAVHGHAWVTLHGRPYFEDAAHWRGFAVMLSYPTEMPR